MTANPQGVKPGEWLGEDDILELGEHVAWELYWQPHWWQQQNLVWGATNRPATAQQQLFAGQVTA